MYSRRFEFILSKTSKFEGLYQNYASDKANYTRSGKLLGTNRGISTMAYEQYLGREPSLAEIKAITPAIAKAVYYKLFWLPMMGDKLKTDGVAWVIFDSYIATGNLKTARKGINKALPAAAISEDSIPFSDYTVKVVNAANQAKIIETVTAANVAQRKTLSTFAQFGEGWLTRLQTIQAEAMLLATPKNIGGLLMGAATITLIVWGVNKLATQETKHLKAA